MRELQQPTAKSTNLALPELPVVETKRLILRQNHPSDLDARCAITDDPDFMRFVGGVYDRQENWSRILRYNGHWQALDYGLFAVEEKGTGRYVGNVGLAHFERELGEDFDPFPEGAWMVAQWAEGRGYASEAMTAVLNWFEQTFGPRRMVCIIDPGNDNSVKLANKLGFRQFREALTRGRPVTLFERDPSPHGG